MKTAAMNSKHFREEYLLRNVINIVRNINRFLDKKITLTSDAYNPSTSVDEEISEYLTEHLSAMLNVPVVSEENYACFKQLENGYAWIIDPLDGTLNALTKTIPFCTSVALVDMSSVQTVCSCIYLPFKDEIYTAIRGKGAFLNGQKITRQTVAKPLIAFGLPNDTMEHIEMHVNHLKAILANSYITRQTGSTVNDIGKLSGLLPVWTVPLGLYWRRPGGAGMWMCIL